MNLNIENQGIFLNEDLRIAPKIIRNTKTRKTNTTNYIHIKRIFDIVAGILGCLVLIPLTIFVYIARVITKENEGPLFYDQLRVGKNGKQFKIYKFRTMVMNADEKLKDYLEENEKAREEYEKYKKLKHDPRVTKLGKFLRRTSIDEFPQFINVLKGEMSIIGPRPYLHREMKDMGDEYNTIICVKPGITGYWQVNGRSASSYKDRMRMDLYYINHRSPELDTRIFFKTFVTVFKREGAM